ncbi:hypothetical protein ACFOQM_15065 [Paenibacillus sp. GCM10012307]
MIRICNITRSFIITYLSLKTALVLISVLVSTCFISLAASGFFDYSVSERDVNAVSMTNRYYNSFFAMVSSIFTFVIVFSIALNFNKSSNNSSDYMYLTGGVSRKSFLTAKLLGVVVINALLFLLLAVLVSSISVFFNISFFEWNIFLTVITHGLNSTLLCLLAVFLVMLSRSSLVGCLPIIAYYLYNIFYSSARYSNDYINIVDSGVYKISNALLPVFTYKPFDITNANEYTYLFNLNLEPHFGIAYFVGYLIILSIISVYIYSSKDL